MTSDWTDNQAYYDWYRWFPNVSSAGRPQDVLMALDAEMESKNLSMAYYQLDAYWYKLEIAPGCCVVDWHAVPDQFPKGEFWGWISPVGLANDLLSHTETAPRPTPRPPAAAPGGASPKCRGARTC